MRASTIVSICVVLAACGGPRGTTDRVGTDAGASDMGAASDAGGDGGTHDLGSGVDAGGGTDSGTTPDLGAAACGAPTVTSSCGVAQSIVRVVARLPAGAAAANGTLTANLAHYRLGGGLSGGVPHTSGVAAGVSIAPGGSAEVQFDMCLGGMMWSEDNCEFNLFAWVDGNGNGMIDAGEPAGRTLMDLSCHAAEAACVTVDLTCTSGASCAGFTDPPGCSCGSPSCAGIGTMSPIVTCS